MPRIIVTGPAKRDIQAAYDWWSANRSLEQASRWYKAIRATIESLRSSPDQHSLATDADLLPQGIRQLNFGLGRHPTHRVLFAIEDTDVIILRVRHTAQDTLTEDDLAS